MIEPRILKVLFTIACCFVLVLVPLTAGAQGKGILEGTKQGIEKGAKEVGKGIEYGVDKTKEGAEKLGEEVKKPFEKDSDKDSDTNVNVDRAKPSQSETGTMPSSTSSGAKNAAGDTETRDLPKTAGELPLLALTGILALAGLASRVTRRNRNRSF